MTPSARLFGETLNGELVVLIEPSLGQGRGGWPGSSSNSLDWEVSFSGDDLCDTALAVIIVCLALAISHTCTGSLSDSLSAVNWKASMDRLNDLSLSDPLTLADDILIGVSELPHRTRTDPFPAILWTNDWGTKRIEVLVLLHLKTSLSKKTNNLNSNGRRASESRRVNPCSVNKVRVHLRRLDDPVASSALCARAPEGVEDLLSIESRHKLTALGEDVGHNILVGLGHHLRKIRVTSRWTKNEIPPKS
jgi:hypothetical protein